MKTAEWNLAWHSEIVFGSHCGSKKSKVLCTGVKVNPFICFLSFPRSLRFFELKKRNNSCPNIGTHHMGCRDKIQVTASVYTMSKESHILIEIFTHFGNVMD